MKRWTIWHQAFFCCGVACCSVVAIAMLAAWPVVLIPKLWDGYTCWENNDVQND